MKALSEREQPIMGIIWEKRHCSVDDVLQEMPEPKPAYTTVQTFMRILEQKGFLGHRQEGKKHVFYPLIEKGEYTRWTLKNLKDSLFDGSAKFILDLFKRFARSSHLKQVLTACKKKITFLRVLQCVVSPDLIRKACSHSEQTKGFRLKDFS